MIVVLIATLTNYAIGADDQLMPEWFWETPDVDGVHFAVGFAQVYVRNIEASFAEAYEDANKRLYEDSGCRVIGERALGSGPTGAFSLGEIVNFEIDEEGFQDFSNGIVHIDSLRHQRFVVVLVATGATEVDNELVPSPSVEAARKCLRDKNFMTCGSGICKTSYYQSLSWQEAERAARVEAAFIHHSVVNHLQQVLDGQMVNVTVNKTDVRIADYRTVGRALDAENKQVWVFVEAIREP